MATGVSGLNPEIAGLRPHRGREAGPGRANMTIGDIDLVEINEAFAAQVIPSADELGIDFRQAERERRRDRPRPPLRHDRRPHHRHADQRFEDADGTFGLETICVGGGQGMAMTIERL